MIQSTRHKQALDYALQAIRTSPVFPYIVDVYLCGSCARQTETWGSDVDLLVELHSSDTLPDILRKPIRLLKTDVMTDNVMDPEVDLKFVYGDDWRRSTMLFYENVRNEGVRLCL